MIKLIRNLMILIAAVSGSAAIANDAGWTISEADGQVSVQRGDKGIYGASGTALKIGDVVKTSKSGRAVLSNGDQFHILEPNQKVRIAKPEKEGAVAQVLGFIGGMFTADKKQSTFRETQLAAVVKGYGKGLEGFQQSSEKKPESSTPEE
ncbi:MAG: hypothetical protein SXU28_07575 [Pseudomonadota bacterium]|nr:hypothetical protein [Pseudomonadota bacterium]